MPAQDWQTPAVMRLGCPFFPCWGFWDSCLHGYLNSRVETGPRTHGLETITTKGKLARPIPPG